MCRPRTLDFRDRHVKPITYEIVPVDYYYKQIDLHIIYLYIRVDVEHVLQRGNITF